jgi:hypothetical protein
MPSIIIIDKTGSVKSTNVKSLEVSELYKKCGFKSANGFALNHTWPVSFNGVEYALQLYGKIDGKAGGENKYEFPPPVDKTLFFGSCAVLNIENGVVSNMSTQEFNDIMDYLQGGYSDIGSEEEEEEDSVDDTIPTTKQGYKKDGFVVDDEDEDEEEDSDVEPVKKKNNKTKTVFAAAENYVAQVMDKDISTAANTTKDKSKSKEKKSSICIKKPTKPRAKKVEEPAPNYCSENVSIELVEEEYLERI